MKKVSRHMKLFLGLVVFIACISLVKLKMFAADSLTVGEDYLKSNMERSLYDRLGRNETELNEPARRIYDAIAQKIDVIDLSDLELKKDDIKPYWEEAVSLDPLIEESYNGIKYTRVFTSQDKLLRLKIKYGVSEKEEFLERYQELQSAVLVYLDKIEAGNSDAEKVLYLHNMLAENVGYAKKLSDETYESMAYTAYGALVKGSAVCDGYTYAFDLISKYVGIDAMRVSNQENTHAWNAVKMDGEWYFVDVMCDDPYIAGEDREGIFRYERLLRTESELRGSSDLYSGEFKYEKNIDNFGYKFSNMPTGTNSVQTYNDGYWYVISNDGKAINKLDIYGNFVENIVLLEDGNISAMSIHNDKIYLTNKRTLLIYNITLKTFIPMSYTPADYLFCYAVYLKNDTKLVLYYLNSETDFVVEEHELSERLDVGFIKNEDGNIYYRYPNGEYATGVTNIEGEEYYFAADGCMKIGYRKIGNKRYYFDPESGKSMTGVYNTGSYVFDFQGKGEVAKGLTEVDGELYYFHPQDGNAMKGLRIINGKKYYFDAKSYKAVEGFMKIGNYTYYFSPDSKEALKGLVEAEGEEYYFDADGCMKMGYRKIGDKRYYFDPESGKSMTGVYNTGSYVFDFLGKGEVAKGLTEVDGELYYFHPQDGNAMKGLRIINGKKYYFDAKSYKAVEGFMKIGNYTYYFSPDSKEALKGLVEAEGEEYYFDADGCMKMGYRKIGDKRYYFDPESGKSMTGVYNTGSYVFDFLGKGEVAKGLTEVDGELYYFHPQDGNALKGLRVIGNERYYFNDIDYKAESGFVTIDSNTYYFNPITFKSVSGEVEIEGNIYRFDVNGVLK